MNLKSLLLNCRELLNEEHYRSRLSAFIVSFISACPVVLVVVFSYVRTSEELTASELSRRQAIVGLAAATLQEKFHRLTDLSLSLATRVRFRQLVEAGDWQEAIKILQSVSRDFSFIDRLTIADTSGIVVADTPELPGVKGMSVAHRDWHRSVMAAGKPYVSEIYQRSGNPQSHVIEIAAPITNASGKMVGILTLQVTNNTLLDWLNDIDTGSRGFLFLVDHRGKTVAHPKLPVDTNAIDYSNLAPVRNALQGRRGVALDVKTESGEEQVLAYEPVANYGWGMVLEQSRSSAFELVDRSLRRLLIAYIGVGLGAIAIAYLLLRAFIFAKDMTSALSDSREQFRAVAETANDAVVISDTQGKIVYFNPAATRLFDYSAEEAIGQPMTIIMPERFHDLHRRGFERYLAGGPSKVIGKTVELAGRRKDGSEFPLELSLANWRTDKDLFFTGILRDITARKSMEEQLRAKNELLEAQNREVQQANRLKSEFLANMSHELRTPLNAIIGFAQLMHDGKVGAVSPQHREYLGDILVSSKHLLELINAVLDLAKVEAGKMEFNPEPVSLTKLVKEVTQILQTLSASKRLTVAVEVDQTVEQLVIDPAKLKQVLYNYLSNAIKFTPEGGRIAVRGVPAQPGFFRMEVEDNGEGIEPEDLDKLFVEFQQLEPTTTKKHQGTGLGLALTKKIVEAQGGRVSVQSKPGRGSVFAALLPCHAQAKEQSRIYDQPASQAIATGPSVLVVEDNEADRQWLAKIIGDAGYVVQSAVTGAEGIAKAQADQFAAIILDLILPDVGGWEVLRAVRAGGPNQQTPVIVATVVAKKEVAKGFPIKDFLTKPIAPEALLEALKDIRVDTGGKKRILVVDDDPNTLTMAEAVLQAGGYEAVCYANAKSALQAATESKFSAVVLDLVMPEVGGFEFLARFRELSSCKKTPVVVWTSKDITIEDCHRLKNSAQSITSKDGIGINAVLRELQRHVGRPAEGATVDASGLLNH